MRNGIVAADMADVSPPPDPISSTLTPPSALRTKPRLEDFSSEFDLTVSLISTMLESAKNDVALHFMIDHKDIQRLFSPRQVFRRGVAMTADYRLQRPRAATAMAWYLLDRGEVQLACSACLNKQGLGPFGECFVPSARRAGGACTNCLFMGRGTACTHRTDKPREEELTPRCGLSQVRIRRATRIDLMRWVGRIRGELDRREDETRVARRRNRKRKRLS